MHKLKYLSIAIILAVLLSLAGLSFSVSAQPLAATSPVLGAADSYSVLGGETVTNTGPTTMPGDLGVYPGSAVTDSPGVGGVIHAGDQNAHDAQDANTAAFIYLGNQNCTKTYTGTKDLVGENLVAGVYCADAFALSGTLTLKGSGVWIFKSSADLNTTGDAKVVGGDPCNVWWREVSSATLGVGTQFIGNILASTSISLDTNARLNGRALAQTGEVSMDSNIITGPICAEKPKPTSKPTSKPKSTNVPSSQQTATALASLGGLPGLPSTGGGAPIQDEDFPWSLVFVGGLSAMALVLGVRAFRRSYRQRP